MAATHTHNVDRRRADPTGTKTLRERRFVPDLRQRFRALRGLLRATVGYENDALDLASNAAPGEYSIGKTRPPSVVVNSNGVYSYVRVEPSSTTTFSSGVRKWKRVRVPTAHFRGFHDGFGDGLSANAVPSEPFDFPTDAEKEAAFARWVQTAIDEEVLEPVGDLGVRNGEHYTGRYIRGSYSKGVSDADRRLRDAGIAVDDADVAAALNLPVHESTLQRLYARSFENLENITDDTAAVIREELTRGLADGVNPNEMARRITKEVRTIERTRAVVLARTETINAYSEATLQRYEQMGVGEVTVEAEWLTAGDDRVCPICESLEGRTFTTQQARSETFSFDGSEFPLKPPAHPSCRCALAPSVS